MKFKDQVAIVTGGAGGIGSATAHRLSELGASLLVVDRDDDGAQRVAKSIVASGGVASAYAADLRDRDAVSGVARAVMTTYGRVDVLANIAGYFPGDEPRLDASTRKQWDLTMDVNLRAVSELCAQVLPHMVAGGGGAIVNVSSTQARAADVAWASYGVAKAGVEALTRYIATQFGAAGVRCNCVAPGLTGTDNALARLPEATADAIRQQTPLGRIGLPEELADAIVFLASSWSSFITGQVLAVDGGLMCHMPTMA